MKSRVEIEERISRLKLLRENANRVLMGPLPNPARQMLENEWDQLNTGIRQLEWVLDNEV